MFSEKLLFTHTNYRIYWDLTEIKRITPRFNLHIQF